MRPSAAIVWLLVAILVLGGALATAGLTLALAPLVLLFAVLWIAPILECNRLERGLRATADAVHHQLEQGGPLSD